MIESGRASRRILAALSAGTFIILSIPAAVAADRSSMTIRPGTDWPMFHYSLDRTGYNRYETILSPSNVSELVPKWKARASGPISTSPAVVGGVVFAGDFEGNLLAIDAATGNTLWETSLGNQGVSDPAVSQGMVYVGTDANGQAVAVNTETGNIEWTKQTGAGVFDSPAVSNGLVYIGSNDGRLYALDALTGDTEWAVPVRPSSSAAVKDGVVYVGSYNAKVYAVSASTGATVWTSDRLEDIIDSTPAVAGGRILVGSRNFPPFKLYALSAATGSTIWSQTLGGPVESSPAVGGRTVYVGCDDHNVYAFDVRTGKLIWSRATGDQVRSSPALANGLVFVGSQDRDVYALDAESGAILWTYATGGTIVLSSPAVSSGVVYIGSFDSKVYAFSLPP